MNKLRRLLKPNGTCYACGKTLKTGTVCFDCKDYSKPQRDIAHELIGRQFHKLEKEGKCDLKPEEGVDYFEEEEVIVYVSGSGSAVAWDNGDMDMDSVDCKHIEWHDMDIDHTEATGKTRKVDANGKIFNEQEWLRKHLLDLPKPIPKRTIAESTPHLRPLHTFQDPSIDKPSMG